MRTTNLTRIIAAIHDTNLDPALLIRIVEDGINVAKIDLQTCQVLDGDLHLIDEKVITHGELFLSILRDHSRSES